MKDAQDKLIERISSGFDGWVVEAADLAVSPFKYESDVEKTVKFFALDQRLKSKAAKSRRRPQPGYSSLWS